MMPHIQDLSGLLGVTPELSEQPTYNGRDASVCDLCFPDGVTAVSRIHASVRWDARLGKCLLRDEGSMNGTFVRGEPRAITEGQDVPIDVGDAFYLGQSNLALRVVR
jgi:pSer/pThr/pTyr-binding forkhead associated (FHA) protein